jgi:hypothetical protein
MTGTPLDGFVCSARAAGVVLGSDLLLAPTADAPAPTEHGR